MKFQIEWDQSKGDEFINECNLELLLNSVAKNANIEVNEVPND